MAELGPGGGVGEDLQRVRPCGAAEVDLRLPGGGLAGRHLAAVEPEEQARYLSAGHPRRHLHPAEERLAAGLEETHHLRGRDGRRCRRCRRSRRSRRCLLVAGDHRRQLGPPEAGGRQVDHHRHPVGALRQRQGDPVGPRLAPDRLAGTQRPLDEPLADRRLGRRCGQAENGAGRQRARGQGRGGEADLQLGLPSGRTAVHHPQVGAQGKVAPPLLSGEEPAGAERGHLGREAGCRQGPGVEGKAGRGRTDDDRPRLAVGRRRRLVAQEEAAAQAGDGVGERERGLQELPAARLGDLLERIEGVEQEAALPLPLLLFERLFELAVAVVLGEGDGGTPMRPGLKRTPQVGQRSVADGERQDGPAEGRRRPRQSRGVGLQGEGGERIGRSTGRSTGRTTGRIAGNTSGIGGAPLGVRAVVLAGIAVPAVRHVEESARAVRLGGDGEPGGEVVRLPADEPDLLLRRLFGHPGRGAARGGSGRPFRPSGRLVAETPAYRPQAVQPLAGVGEPRQGLLDGVGIAGGGEDRRRLRLGDHHLDRAQGGELGAVGGEGTHGAPQRTGAGEHPVDVDDEAPGGLAEPLDRHHPARLAVFEHRQIGGGRRLARHPALRVVDLDRQIHLARARSGGDRSGDGGRRDGSDARRSGRGGEEGQEKVQESRQHGGHCTSPPLVG